MMFEPIPLSLALAHTPEAANPRSAIDRAPARGFQWVQLDATQRGVRPRELDGSARRDLAASVSRADVQLSGLDLMIPSGEFTNSETVDRAVAAVLSAVDLLGDLMRLNAAGVGSAVSLILPKDVDPLVVESMQAAADRAGVLIADHAIQPNRWTAIGLDPAMQLAAGFDPVALASQDRLVTARLSDASEIGRVPVGLGGLSVLEFGVALSTASYRHAVVVDVRGLPDPVTGIELAQRAWAQMTLPE